MHRSYLCCVLSTWTFILSLMFELQPVLFTQQFKIASSCYLFATFTVSTMLSTWMMYHHCITVYRTISHITSPIATYKP